MPDSLLDALEAMDKELAPGPWCKDIVYSQVRHVVRNCEIECYTHTTGDELMQCNALGKYDGPAIVALRNSLPKWIAYVRANDAYLLDPNRDTAEAAFAARAELARGLEGKA